MATKLIKVAKEFNVGLHTIVETLHNKGFHGVEEKPTADISDEMLLVLQKEFQKDLAIKKEADKLARPVLKKEPPAPTVTTTPASSAPSTPATPRPSLLPPREPAAPKAEPNPPPPPPPWVAKEEPAPEPRRERPGGLRILGKIDLDKPKAQPQPKKEEPKPAPPPPP
ncbi:MAG: translation initiation factor IF-2, partial [Bacteroidota bacterium]